MKKGMLFLVALLATPSWAQTVSSEKKIVVTTSEENIHVQKVLNGRACRAASDQDWLQVCRSAIILSDLLDEARDQKATGKP